MKEKKKTTVYLSVELHEKLLQTAKQNNTSVNDEIVHAITQYILVKSFFTATKTVIEKVINNGKDIKNT